MSATKATPITLGGKEHALRFSNRALVLLEDRTGKTFTQLGAMLTQGSLRATSELIWAGLQHEEPAPSVDEVIDLIDLQQLEPLAVAIAGALGTALGPAPKEEAGTPNPPAA